MDSALLDQLKQLRTRNDWQAIYRRFAPVEEIPANYPELWSDASVLSEIGFACGKLAETTTNDLPRDEPRRSTFLKGQAAYREATERLRRRCTELVPENAGYWSDLAYFHYQNVQELSEARGRRDGNIRREIDAALAYFDKALSLDPRRIKDHYRKGRLLTRYLPDQILFGRQSGSGSDRAELATAKRLEGIEALLTAVRLWEALSPKDQRQEWERKRCRKEYIRSLYNAGWAYYDLIVRDWDPAVFALRLRDGIPASADIRYNPADLEHANQAQHYFYACWLADRVQVGETAVPVEAGIPGVLDGVVDGVYKLYWLGKVAFVKYWILSGYGQRDTTQATDERDLAERLLTLALECPWQAAHARMRKDFIAELLARLFITKGNYAQAIEVIEKYRSAPFLEPYVAHTLSLALLMDGRYAAAQDVLRSASAARSNRALWTCWLLIGCTALAEGHWQEANAAFTTADREARRQGKQTIDTVLIGQAFASYKLGRMPEALDYLSQAVQLNQHRWAARRRLEQWQTATHAPG